MWWHNSWEYIVSIQAFNLCKPAVIANGQQATTQHPTCPSEQPVNFGEHIYQLLIEEQIADVSAKIVLSFVFSVFPWLQGFISYLYILDRYLLLHTLIWSVNISPNWAKKKKMKHTAFQWFHLEYLYVIQLLIKAYYVLGFIYPRFPVCCLFLCLSYLSIYFRSLFLLYQQHWVYIFVQNLRTLP